MRTPKSNHSFIVLAAVFSLSLTSPAQATFCYYEPSLLILTDVFKLSGPECGGGNRLIFKSRTPIKRNGGNKAAIETFLAESWNDGLECKSAGIGLRRKHSSSDTIVVIKDYRWKVKHVGFGGSVLRYYEYPGSCSAFKKAVAGHVKDNTVKDDYVGISGLKEVDKDVLIKTLIEDGSD